jgi:hypothetical protein
MGSTPEPIKAKSVSQYSTDAALVEQAAAGNEWAFELLVEPCVYHHLVCTEVMQDVVELLPHEKEKDFGLNSELRVRARLSFCSQAWIEHAKRSLDASSFHPLVLDGT